MTSEPVENNEPPGDASIPPDAVFRAGAEKAGIAFDNGDLAALERYLILLRTANTRFNLTRITRPEELWTRHVLDSLSLLAEIQELQPGTVLDLGSGGGVPGIPLALMLPDLSFTLLESTGKKARFLRDTVQELGLANVEVCCARAETEGAAGSPRRGHWDLVTARAVGPMPVLLELAVPLLRIGGFLLAIKGRKAREDIRAAGSALHRLKAVVRSVRRTSTGTVVAVEKVGTTLLRYPRRPGEPGRMPLH